MVKNGHGKIFFRLVEKNFIACMKTIIIFLQTFQNMKQWSFISLRYCTRFLAMKYIHYTRFWKLVFTRKFWYKILLLLFKAFYPALLFNSFNNHYFTNYLVSTTILSSNIMGDNTKFGYLLFINHIQNFLLVWVFIYMPCFIKLAFQENNKT